MNDSPVEPLGIVELAGVADHLATSFALLAERLGTWATGDDVLPDADRRWCATMSNRHAWHAELWRSRRPAIPIDTEPRDPVELPIEPDLDRYRSVVDDLRREIATLAERADPDLDPATRWTSHLTLADRDSWGQAPDVATVGV